MFQHLPVRAHKAAHAQRSQYSTPIRSALTRLVVLDEQKNHVDPETNAYTRLMKRCVALADKIIGMPAESADDLLDKITAAGILADRDNDTELLSDWTPTPTGFVCNDGLPKLLLSLRSDLKRLHGVV